MSMLERIEMVTLGCALPAAVEQAYCRYLHYRRVGSGYVSDELAQLWGRDALTGTEYTLLAPHADDRHFLRLLQTDADPVHPPFRAPGWSAAEVLVNDVDSLAETLAESPFTLVGPPADLSFTDKIRACQVVGPAGEALYLTQIKGMIPAFDLPQTEQTAAHCFVVILTTASLTAGKACYLQRFGIADAPAINARVTMLSRAFGLPRDHLHRISALTLGNPGYLIEVDELPPAGAGLPEETGLIAPGIALVSFSGSSHADDGNGVTLIEPPYNGRRVSFYTGESGEMLELIHP